MRALYQQQDRVPPLNTIKSLASGKRERAKLRLTLKALTSPIIRQRAGRVNFVQLKAS
jgi:hypothetical protein